MLRPSLLTLVAIAGACAGPAGHAIRQPEPAPQVSAPDAAPEPDTDPALLRHLDHLSLRLANLDPAVRIQAAVDLAEYGPEARPVLAFLIACMVDVEDEAAETCALAVAAIGEAAVPHLERVIASRPDSRALAEQTLSLIEASDEGVRVGRN